MKAAACSRITLASMAVSLVITFPRKHFRAAHVGRDLHEEAISPGMVSSDPVEFVNGY